MFCEELVKSSGLNCKNKYKIIRDNGKKVCGRHIGKRQRTKVDETVDETKVDETKVDDESQNKLKMIVCRNRGFFTCI